MTKKPRKIPFEEIKRTAETITLTPEDMKRLMVYYTPQAMFDIAAGKLEPINEYSLSGPVEALDHEEVAGKPRLKRKPQGSAV